MKYGRKNHPDDKDLKTEIFGCYVANNLKSIPRYRWKQAFKSLTDGRDDIDAVRKIA